MLGPVLSRGAAHQVEDLVNLLHLAFARQQGGVQNELSHDAAHAPHVDGCRVLLHTCMDRQASEIATVCLPGSALRSMCPALTAPTALNDQQVTASLNLSICEAVSQMAQLSAPGS